MEAATTQRSLIRKLSEVMASVTHVEKTGKNLHFGYAFATEADVVASVRKEMAARHLMLIPSVTKTEFLEQKTKNGAIERVYTVTIECSLCDGDLGEVMTMVGSGQGTDPGDKGIFKAITGAMKYIVLKLFLIPTGDDPERDDEPPQRTKPQPPPKPPVDTSEIVKAFEGYGQTVAMLEQHIGKPLAQAVEADVTKLRALYAEKKRLATLDPDVEAKRLEQEKAEKGIADEQAATRAKIDAQMKALEKPVDAFAGYVERVRLATTPGTVALVVAEAVSNGIKAGDLKALQRTANDRTLVLADSLRKIPETSAGADLPF